MLSSFLHFARVMLLVASTGLFALVLALWLRSESRDDSMIYWSQNRSGFNFSLNSAGGIVVFERLLGGFEDPADAPTEPSSFEFATQQRKSGKIYDVGWKPDDEWAMRRFYLDRAGFVAAPHWSLAALTGIVPLLRIFGMFRRAAVLRRRRRGNCCPSCGYDWRATPTRCPECGFAEELG